MFQLRDCIKAYMVLLRSFLRALPWWWKKQGSGYPRLGVKAVQRIMKQEHWPAYRERMLWACRAQEEAREAKRIAHNQETYSMPRHAMLYTSGLAHHFVHPRQLSQEARHTHPSLQQAHQRTSLRPQQTPTPPPSPQPHPITLTASPLPAAAAAPLVLAHILILQPHPLALVRPAHQLHMGLEALRVDLQQLAPYCPLTTSTLPPGEGITVSSCAWSTLTTSPLSSSATSATYLLASASTRPCSSRAP
jgi:hypothetical protein